MLNERSHDHSSSILTLQSVPEFHRFSQMYLSAIQVADYTADREFHPALKNFAAKVKIFFPDARKKYSCFNYSCNQMLLTFIILSIFLYFSSRKPGRGALEN